MPIVLVILFAFLTWPLSTEPANAGQTPTYSSQPGCSTIKISGTTNLCDWDAKGTTIKGLVQFTEERAHRPPRAELKFPQTGNENDRIAFSVPVQSFKSQIPGMAEAIWEDLNYKQHPNIDFRFIRAVYKSSPRPGEYLFDVYGLLYINGVGRNRRMELTVKRPDQKKLIITVKTAIKMTEHNITPPMYMEGLVKSDDAVAIDICWNLDQCRQVVTDAQYWPPQPDAP